MNAKSASDSDLFVDAWRSGTYSMISIPGVKRLLTLLWRLFTHSGRLDEGCNGQLSHDKTMESLPSLAFTYTEFT